MSVPSTLESSRDFLQIPPHKMSADTVLQWEIFDGKYGQNALIGALFQPREGQGSSKSQGVDEVVRTTGLRPPDDERIPSLIDSFLQNVHTKNPVLDVESLVKHGRKCTEQGIGWDGSSCLVLLACALGSVAKPFDTSISKRTVVPPRNISLPSLSTCGSSHVYAAELQQAESCFALACRRLGLLTHTMVGAQCYFFAGGQSGPPLASFTF